MKRTFLETIVAKTRQRIAKDYDEYNSRAIEKAARLRRASAGPHRLKQALIHRDRVNIIAEIKRASPSKGVISENADPAAISRLYVRGGAAAISVLTEPEYFYGSLNDLIAVRDAVEIPVLRKDFIVDRIQIYEAAAAGADAVLLIAAALSEAELIALLRFTEKELEMDALVEVHTAYELTRAVDAGGKIIGINNRNLHTLEVDLDVSRRVIAHRPEHAVMIAESGIASRSEIQELRARGFDGFLIGETLMRSGDPVGELLSLTAL
jgi:indole-3-glycerol phosphate synthase